MNTSSDYIKAGSVVDLKAAPSFPDRSVRSMIRSPNLIPSTATHYAPPCTPRP